MRSSDDHVFILQIESLELQKTDNGNWINNDWIVVQARMRAPQGESTETFKLEDTLIVRRVLSHETLVYVRRDLRNGLLGDKPMAIGLLGFGKTELAVDGSGGSWWQGFRGLFRLGMQHIAEGTDHQLFLLSLLLAAPLRAVAGRWRSAAAVGQSLRNLVVIVSGFTLGHSTTLALAAIGWIRAPAQIVEVLIAFSILVSSVHAWRPLFAGREIWIASGFGLVHGLAFAEVLSGLNFDGWSLTLSLLGFNLGIEAMQLLIVGLVFPWLLLLSRAWLYGTLRRLGSLFAATAAIGWIAQRLTGQANILSNSVDQALSHGLAILAALAVCAIGLSVVHYGSVRCRRAL
jgi:hypothetical protein